MGRLLKSAFLARCVMYFVPSRWIQPLATLSSTILHWLNCAQSPPLKSFDSSRFVLTTVQPIAVKFEVQSVQKVHEMSNNGINYQKKFEISFFQSSEFSSEDNSLWPICSIMSASPFVPFPSHPLSPFFFPSFRESFKCFKDPRFSQVSFSAFLQWLDKSAFSSHVSRAAEKVYDCFGWETRGPWLVRCPWTLTSLDV